MDEFAPFISVKLDYSLLSNAFKKIMEKLNEHDAKIKEHDQLLQSKADSFDLLALKNQTSKNETDQTNATQENTNKIQKLSNDFNNKIIEITNQLERQAADTADNVIMQLKADGLIQPTKPESVTALDDIYERLSRLESNLQENVKQTNKADDNIKGLIEKLNELNTPEEMRLSKPGGAPITMPENPIEQISDTVSTVNHKFDTIFKRLPEENEVRIVSARSSARSPRNQEENVVVTRDLDNSNDQTNNANTNVNVNTQPTQNIVYHQTVINHEISRPYEVDFSSMRPGPSIKWNIDESPDLPPLITFNNLADPIDYIYRLVPTLQGILVGMTDAIHEQKENNVPQVSKESVDNMFDKLSNSFKELAKQVIRLSEQMQGLPTMADLRQAISGIQINDLPETAIGVVHCMTCGREISQVTGAMSYEEAVKQLGRAPTSIAGRGSAGKSLGIQYTGRSNFDSTICESPRSVRSARSSTPIKITRK